MFIVGLGAVLFGLAIGWIAYRMLRQQSGPAWLSNLIALLGIIAGAVALAFFRDDAIFGWYALGLVIGFFAYFAVGVVLYGKQEILPWRLEPVSSLSPSETQEAQQSAQPEEGKRQTRGRGRSATQKEQVV